MFQAFFMENVGHPPNKSHQQMLEEYSFSYGFPPPGNYFVQKKEYHQPPSYRIYLLFECYLGMAVKLQQTCFEIYKVSTWQEFYTRIGLQPVGKARLTRIFRDAVKRYEIRY